MLNKGHLNAHLIDTGDIHPYIFNERNGDFYTGMMVVDQTGGESIDIYGFKYKVVKGNIHFPCGRELRKHAVRCYSLDDGYAITQIRMNVTLLELKDLLVDIHQHPQEYGDDAYNYLVRVWNFLNFMKSSKIDFENEKYIKLLEIVDKSYRWMVASNCTLSDEYFNELREWRNE